MATEFHHKRIEKIKSQRIQTRTKAIETKSRRKKVYYKNVY